MQTDTSGTTELLEHGPERHTPRALVVTGWVVVVVAALAYGWLRYAHHEQALDRAAAAAVHLSVTFDPRLDLGGPAGPPDVVRLGLHNDGTDPVRLLSVRVQAPGYAAVPLVGVLAPATTTGFALADTAPCSPALLSHPAERLEVTVRTRRGRTVRALVPLRDDAHLVDGPAQARCGYEGVLDALSLTRQGLRRAGDTVVVRLVLADRSLLPLQLLALRPTEGLAVSPSAPLPLSLRPQAAPGQLRATTTLDVRLRVTSCEQFTEIASQFLGTGTELPELVDVELQGQDGSASLQWTYATVLDPEESTATDALLATCGATA